MREFTTYRTGQLAIRAWEGESHWRAWQAVHATYESERDDRRQREQETELEAINRRIRTGPLKSDRPWRRSGRMSAAERITLAPLLGGCQAEIVAEERRRLGC